ncbi:hypothetical protein CspeluHIS016_0207610 [Cutaneotrichosporon spelunceum]|uniref:Uncharacterized protein n=1 Tax=Cutaneotrichosporon spelunceum TaxID=1672016 RepID=A0AAD3TSN1_9TREE|nr:hypothetical protein CspeluHIS016_0207610 [Cutaneotrichosporon spelunceum]
MRLALLVLAVMAAAVPGPDADAVANPTVNPPAAKAEAYGPPLWKRAARPPNWKRRHGHRDRHAKTRDNAGSFDWAENGVAPTDDLPDSQPDSNLADAVLGPDPVPMDPVPMDSVAADSAAVDGVAVDSPGEWAFADEA